MLSRTRNELAVDTERQDGLVRIASTIVGVQVSLEGPLGGM